MPTAPDQVRAGLQIVTSAAQDDVRAVAAASESPAEARAALFAAAPLIVEDYIDGSAALALDWYEELREAANAASRFTPTPLTLVTNDDVKAMVAATTSKLRDIEREIEVETQRLLAEVTEEVAAGVQKQVASGFWDTVTGNVAQDPDAVGWQRFARGGACKFCRMLAGRGAVYKESTVHFAAHTTCHCVAGPSFDPDAPKASVMQYVAAKRTRTEKERADLRAYLNANYPDSPG